MFLQQGSYIPNSIIAWNYHVVWSQILSNLVTWSYWYCQSIIGQWLHVKPQCRKYFLAYKLAICGTVLWLLSYCVSDTWHAAQDFNDTIWKCNNACHWNAGFVWATPTCRNCLPARPHDLEHKFHRPLLFAKRGQAALWYLGNDPILLYLLQICSYVHTRNKLLWKLGEMWTLDWLLVGHQITVSHSLSLWPDFGRPRFLCSN